MKIEEESCPYCGETENIDYDVWNFDNDGDYFRTSQPIFCRNCKNKWYYMQTFKIQEAWNDKEG